MSDAPADTATTDASDTTSTEPSDTPDTGGDLTAELEKWKAQARKHEDRAKANATAAKELEKLREQSMTDQEKAVEEARRAARTEALAEVGAARVDDAVRVAAAGRSVDVDALLDGLDRSKFLTEEHQPDADAIKAWVERIAPEQADPTTTTKDMPEVFDLGQGLNTTSSTDPLLTELKSALGI